MRLPEAPFESSIVREILAVAEQPGMRSLAGGLPDPAMFPADRLAVAAAEVLATDGAGALQYGPTPGCVELRTALAHAPLVQRLTGLDPDDLVVTTGSQQALDLLARVLAPVGSDVVVDDPCYLGARQAFRAAGAVLHGVPLDHDGLRVDVLEARLHAGLRPAFVYTVAQFQNPTGVSLAPERAAALVELARHYGFFVIEDDAYGALAFSGTTAPPLGQLAPDVVITTGSLSKLLAPGLRIGWLRAPQAVRDVVVRAKQGTDLHTASLTQRIAAQVVADDVFTAAHLDRLRASYAARARALTDALQDHCEVTMPAGGMFVWTRVPGVPTDALLDRTRVHDMIFVPGSAFAIDADWSQHARLSFATLDAPTLRDAARVFVTQAGDQAAAPAPALLAAHNRA